MNDQEIKDLLKQDASEPKKPVQEWNQILNKIESSKQGSFFSLNRLAMIGAFCSILIISTLVFQRNQRVSLALDNEVSFILDETGEYLYTDEEELYSWMD